jgi:hypothetical protein
LRALTYGGIRGVTGVRGARVLSRYGSPLAGVGLVDMLVAATLACALWLPSVVGARAWIVPYGALIVVAAWRCTVDRVRPALPIVLVVYVAFYALAAIHGGSIDAAEVARFFYRPLGAVAIATLATGAAQRMRVLVLMAAFIALEIPVSAEQAIRNIIRFGRGATLGVDSVTGTLGTTQGGIASLAALIIAMLLVGAWTSGRLPLAATIPAVALFLAVSVFSSMRAMVLFAPAAGLALATGALFYGSRRPPLRRLVAVAAVAMLAAPVVYVGIKALYPSSFVGFWSNQNQNALGGAAAMGISTSTVATAATAPTAAAPAPTAAATAPTATATAPRATATAPTATATAPTTAATMVPKSAKHRGHGTQASSSPARPTGVALLPGRRKQLSQAYHLSMQSGAGIAVLGRGLGAARLQGDYQTSWDVPLPERTGSTWAGVLLTETGWLGLGAFLMLLVWLVVVGRRIWLAGPRSMADRALALALPGIAAITAFGAVYTTILDVRGYSIPFWLLVGVAISADRAREVDGFTPAAPATPSP